MLVIYEYVDRRSDLQQLGEGDQGTRSLVLQNQFPIADFSSWDLQKVIDDSMVNYLQNGQYIYFFQIKESGQAYNLELQQYDLSSKTLEPL